jgi:hypothetical protein
LACPFGQVRPARSSGVREASRAHAEYREKQTVANSLVALSEQIASTVEQPAQSVVPVHGRHRFESSGSTGQIVFDLTSARRRLKLI